MRFLLVMLLLAAALGRPALAADKPEPYTIAIFGDSLAAGIADGLMHVLKNDGKIRVLRRAKPATGLTRVDVFNWQTRLEEVTAADRFDAAIVLMGTNDRQPVFLDSFRSVPFGTDEWNRLYRERAEAFAEHLARRGIWVIWAGLPAMQNANFNKGMRHIDGIYKKLADKRCVTYVSLYEKTVDGRGNFLASGADIQGRQRVLRQNDGIHFTMPGYDILAKAVVDAMRADVVGCDKSSPFASR
ncbi:MAG TPA: DUF459 domain-containing protein [Azospirillaceae bacterium]|nr:DUF459 domain-containing protein [Azospirillaceae bacterium]